MTVMIWLTYGTYKTNNKKNRTKNLKLIETENRLVVARGRKEGGGWGKWMKWVIRYKLAVIRKVSPGI